MKTGILFFALGIALAQPPEPPSSSATAPPEKREAPEGPSAFEAEFAASSIFKTGSYLQPIWRGLGLDAHYYSGEETSAGFVGASWTFRARGLKLPPGFGVTFGNNEFATAPTFSFRWDYEHAWFVTEGLILQGLRDSPVYAEAEGVKRSRHPVPASYVRPTISDGNHVSLKWKRMTLGGTWEHIQFREVEWKGGGRLAFRLLPRISAVLYVLGPGHAEWRGGILIHPKEPD